MILEIVSGVAAVFCFKIVIDLIELDRKQMQYYEINK